MNATDTETSGDVPGQHILPCNFRSAGRLSNDSIRHLRSMHDAFARNTSHSLDLFLGSPFQVKLVNVEQVVARDFVSSLGAGSYLIPFSIMPLQNRVILALDNAMLFPLLDLMLGGSGESYETVRELTDIDEELIRSVVELIAGQLERVWKACQVSVAPSPSIKVAIVAQMFITEERVVALNFEILLARTRTFMRLAMPMAFCNALARSTHPEATGLQGALSSGSPLRERLLDCHMLASAELRDIAISVGDLIAMEPGSVLDLKTSVEVPVRLNVDEYSLFEVTPVRRGGKKAAQVGLPCRSGGKGSK